MYTNSQISEFFKQVHISNKQKINRRSLWGHRIIILDLVDFFSKHVIEEQKSVVAHFLQINNCAVQNEGPWWHNEYTYFLYKKYLSRGKMKQ